MQVNKFIYVCLFLIVTNCAITQEILPKNSFFCIPISRSEGNTPLMKVEIQGEECLLEIDFGFDAPLSLNKNILKNLEKELIEEMKMIGITGKRYETSLYRLSNVKIGMYNYADIFVEELNDNFLRDSFINADCPEQINVEDAPGLIGRGLLRRMDLILDFPSSALYEYEDEMKLKQDLYQLENLHGFPFEMTNHGIILTVDTDIGTLKLCLDTGFSWSTIRPSLLKNDEFIEMYFGIPYFYTEKFMLGGIDFGGVELELYDFDRDCTEIDGYLGMNFLDDFLIHLDFKNRVMYICES